MTDSDNTMMIHVNDNDSNSNSTELKELLMEFQSLFGALDIDEDTTTAIDILDEDLIITSGITDSLRLAHQSKQEKKSRTIPTKKHIRVDNSSKEQGPSSKRLCCQGNRNRSGIRRGCKVESESSSVSSEEDALSDDS